jgi:beta-galactosidase GanA
MTFPLAVHYYRQPTPLPEEWDADLAHMREMDITTFQVRPQWRWHERREGEFVWDDLDGLFDLSEKHGLEVVFKFMLECAPDWLYRDYAATRIAPDGTRLEPRATGSMYPGGWLPCFDVPDVRERAARFVRACVERYRARPTLSWWHAWNEPRARPYGECACPASAAAYRSWLRGRFGTVDKLNAFFGKCWASFDDIRPPVQISDYAEAYLWRQWSAQSVADRVALVADTCRAADPDHPVMAHVGCASIIQNPLNDTSDDVLTAATVDLYGSSLAAELDTGYGPEATALNCDWIRSVNHGRRWWINEAYSDPNIGFRRECGADHIRHIFLSPIAHGASGVMAWQYRAERYGIESRDDGLVDFDGSDTVRSEETARVGRFLKAHGHLFTDSTVPQSEIAILYDFRSDLISALEGESFGLKGPRQHPYSIPLDYPYNEALHGAYHCFFRAGYQVELLDSRKVERLSDGFKLAYLPLPYVVDARLAEALLAFVRAGGTVVTEAGFCLREESTWLRIGAPAIDELGYRLKRHYRLNGRTVPLNLAGRTVNVSGQLDWLIPEAGGGASPVGQIEEAIFQIPGGAPAMLSTPLGDGLVTALAFSPGLNSGLPEMSTFVDTLAGEAGVGAPIRPEGAGAEGVVLRSLVASDGQALTVLRNAAATDARLLISSLPAFGEDIWRGSRREGEELIIPAGEFALLVAAT